MSDLNVKPGFSAFPHSIKPDVRGSSSNSSRATATMEPVPLPPAPVRDEPVTDEVARAIITGDLGKLGDLIRELGSCLFHASLTPRGETALRLAILSRQPAIARYIALHESARTSQDDPDGVTPMRQAVRSNDAQTLRQLLTLGECENRLEIREVFEAIDTPALDVLRLLVARMKYSEVNAQYNGYNLLTLAVRSGSVDAVKILVEHPKLSATALNADDTTALQWAAKRGNAEMVALIKPLTPFVSLLPLAEQQPWQQPTENLTYPWISRRNMEELAVFTGVSDREAMQLGARRRARRAELASVAVVGPDEKRRKTEHGLYFAVAGDPLDCDVAGRTAYHRAAATGHWPDLTVHVDSRHELRRGDRDGNRPLHVALLNGHSDFALKLLEHPWVDPAIPNAAGATPLLLALMSQSEGLALEMLRREVPVNAVTAQGTTPLFFACRYGMEKAIQALLERKAQIACPYKHPFASAYEHGRERIAEMLACEMVLHPGFDPAAPIFQGKTGAQLAAEKGWTGIAARLAAPEVQIPAQ